MSENYPQVTGATYEDATTLAKYSCLKSDHAREHNPYNDFIEEAMS